MTQARLAHPFHLKPLPAIVCAALVAYGSHCLAEEQGRISTSLSLERITESVGHASPNFINEQADPLAPVLETALAGRDDPALQLQVDRKLVPLNPEDPENYPAFIVADQIEGRQEDVLEARGSVQLRKVGQLLMSDSLTYFPLEDQVEAKGRVRLERGQDVIVGDYLELRLSEQVGHMDNPEFVIQRESKPRGWGSFNAPVVAGLEIEPPKKRVVPGYGEAERINFEGENRVTLLNTTFTSCKPGERDWYAKAEQLNLDYDSSVGKAENATLYFKDVPILYGPDLSFSLNHQRKSGFLPPIWGSSTRSGFDFSLPYYWNIAPNYDLTLIPRYLTKRGPQLGSDFRYLAPHYQGNLKLEVLPNDQAYGSQRYAYSVLHNHVNLGRGFSGQVNWSGVSDDTYWTDLSSRLVQTSQTLLPRQMMLNYTSGSWWTVNSTLNRYQVLQPNKDTVIERPYFLEPQINFNGRLPDFFKTDVALPGQYTSFTHPTKVQGQRVVAYPQIALPLVSPGYYFTPKIGFHATQYSLSQISDSTPASQTRSLPIFSLDSGLIFERDTQLFGKAYTQTLEPRLFYVNVPYRDQSRIPLFDTAVADFNFAQIFSENRYVGNDRLGDTNQLTAAVTTRYIDPATGGERFKAMLGQRYYYRDQKIGIQDEVIRNGNYSNLIAAFTGSILPKTYVDAAVEYDRARRDVQRFSLGTRYQPAVGKALSFSYRMTDSQLEQIDIAGQWPVSHRWYAVGRYNYSLRDGQMVEALGGFEYKAGCWVSRFVAQRLQSVGGSPVTNFFYQLELNDFAQIGTNPIQLLRRSVPGYGRINDLGDVNDSTLLPNE